MNSALPPDALARWMADAMELALGGRFRVEPNPPVGAVVLDGDGNLAGRGFHARWGGPHAEVQALAAAGERARGGTMVVTLEPCAHTGTGKKTPPCVPGIVAAGIARVVAGAPDPNPLTAGRAARELAAAGIAYEVGTPGVPCGELLARYAAHLRMPHPWTVAKWAMSADGRIADHAGRSRWLSGEASRALVQELRAGADAVVVGRGTAAADDPLLRSEAPGARVALRVVIDSRLSIAPSARLVTTARATPTLLVCTEAADAERRAVFEAQGAAVAVVPAGADGRVDLETAFRELCLRGVRRVLCEAGGVLTGALCRAGLVHQAAVFVAPLLLGAGPAPTAGGPGWPLDAAPRLEEPRVTRLGSDALLEGYLPRATAA